MCLKDLNRAVELKPTDKVILTLRNNLINSLKVQNKKDKKQFNGMFERGKYFKAKERHANGAL